MNNLLMFASSTLFAAVASAAPLSVVFETSKGSITIQLEPEKTPVTSANFANLVKRGFYNGQVFHRVIDGFMMQGGDPTGTGRGGPGYQFEDEIVPELKHSGPGVLSMANAGAGTNGSQFFITFAAQPHLNGKHTVFGKVTAGMEVVTQIRQGDKLVSAKLEGDTTALFEKEKNRITAWNKVLDAK